MVPRLFRKKHVLHTRHFRYYAVEKNILDHIKQIVVAIVSKSISTVKTGCQTRNKSRTGFQALKLSRPNEFRLNIRFRSHPRS